MSENNNIRRSTIAQLNDQVRKHVGLSSFHFHATNPHRVVMTAGISALPSEDQVATWKRIRAFDAVTADNDPHGDHDFGAIEHGGKRSIGRSTTTAVRWNTAAKIPPIRRRLAGC